MSGISHAQAADGVAGAAVHGGHVDQHRLRLDLDDLPAIDHQQPVG